MRVQWKSLLLLALLTVGTMLNSAAQTAKPAERAAWNPTQFAIHGEDYAGSAACAVCHKAQAGQKHSEMGLSVLRPVEARVLAEHPSMSFQRGTFSYTLRKEGAQVSFTAADGHSAVTEPVFAVVGSGNVFQAYLIEHGGAYYRVPVDYFAAQGKLGLDAEAGTVAPTTLEAALGQKLSTDDMRGCMRCHSPAAVVGDRFDMQARTLGIGCEVCHGPGAKHVAAMGSGARAGGTIFNPAHLRVEAQMEFCDQCHESAAKMRDEHPHGTRSVVSPEYRLAGSRCWNASEQRISCVGCHDSHSAMAVDTASYDSKCQACHAVLGGAPARADQRGKICKVGQRNCAGCHMPRTNIPNSPILFTDHRIRIASAGAKFPE